MSRTFNASKIIRGEGMQPKSKQTPLVLVIESLLYQAQWSENQLSNVGSP